MNLSVSVIIPTFNRAALLTQAIASVCLQTYTPLEILVVDDGSTDETEQVVRSFGDAVRYLYQENQGPAVARNLGITNAQGDVLTFLDDDDLWVPEALEWGVARLQDPSIPPFDMVFGSSQRAKSVEWTNGTFTFEPIPPVWTTMLFSTVFCRKEVFARVGLLDPLLKMGEDVDWCLRVREQGVPFGFLFRVTHLYRMHPTNMTKDTAKTHHYFLKALKQSLTRRSDAGGQVVTALPELPDVTILKSLLEQKVQDG